MPGQFLAQFLAPLPEGAVQAADPDFLRDLSRDRRDEWHRAMRYARFGQYLYDAAGEMRLIALYEKGKASPEYRKAADEEIHARRQYWLACDRLMSIPAPRVAALRWKQKVRKFDGGSQAWERSIATDELALAAELAKGTRGSATRRQSQGLAMSAAALKWEGALSLRQRLEDEIERLIATLDVLDGDENLEPSLASNGPDVSDDREGDPCDEGEPEDNSEPSLGWGIPGGASLTTPLKGWSYARFGGVAGDYED